MLVYFQNLSIRAKIFICFITVILIQAIVFSIAVYVRSSSIMQDEYRKSVHQTVMAANANLLNHMFDAEGALFAVQSNKKIQTILTTRDANPLDEISKLENELLSIDIFPKKTTTTTLYVIDRKNYAPSFNSGVIFASYMAENEPWYDQTVRANGAVVWNVFHKNDLNGTISASRLIVDAYSYKPIAVARSDISILHFTQDLNKIVLGKHGKLFLASDNHVIHASSDKFVGQFVNNTFFFNMINKQSDDGFINIDNTKYLISYGSLKDSGLKVVGAVPYVELDYGGEVLANTILVTAILCILFTIALSLVLSAGIAVPIKRLALKMENFSVETMQPVEVSSHNEISSLYESYNTMIGIIDKLINDVNVLNKKQKVAELKALQAQINPHFLYNSLDSINWMTKKYKANDISHMIKLLASFFRHSLNKGQEYTSVENELNHVKSYVEIQKTRFEDKFDIIIDVDDDVLKLPIVKLSMQPLVENSITHGFEDVDYIGLIEITGFCDSEYMYIQIEDNGVGCDIDELNQQVNKDWNFDEPIEKYGLHNVNQRIKLYFNGQSGLYFEHNTPTGVRGIIKIAITTDPTKG